MSLSLFKLGRRTVCEEQLQQKETTMVDLKKSKVEYKSESKGTYMDVRDMNHEHLVNMVRMLVTHEKTGTFRITREDGTKTMSYMGHTNG